MLHVFNIIHDGSRALNKDINIKESIREAKSLTFLENVKLRHLVKSSLSLTSRSKVQASHVCHMFPFTIVIGNLDQRAY